MMYLIVLGLNNHSYQRWTKSGVWTLLRRTPHVFLQMRSPNCFFIGGVHFFFLIFFAHLKLIVASIFLAEVSWKICFADTALSFSVDKSLFLHLVLLSVCRI